MTPNTIQFNTQNNTWVMRITADRRIEVNEDVEVTEAAKKVLEAMQWMLDNQKRPWVGLTEEQVITHYWKIKSEKKIGINQTKLLGLMWILDLKINQYFKGLMCPKIPVNQLRNLWKLLTKWQISPVIEGVQHKVFHYIMYTKI